MFVVITVVGVVISHGRGAEGQVGRRVDGAGTVLQAVDDCRGGRAGEDHGKRDAEERQSVAERG